MNIAIDIGNTRTKAGVFEGRRLHEHFVLEGNATVDDLREWQKKFKPHHCIVSSVKTLDMNFENALKELPSAMLLGPTTDVPLTVRYDSRETLGQDRLCGAVAGAARFPGENVLVIDAGTCITYDIVDSGGHYRGGAIAPGLQMRLNAMHRFTDKLPALTLSGMLDLIGNSTTTCMHMGAERGALLEAEGFIAYFKAHFQGLQVILTGGDGPFFERHIENRIFAAPNLVLEGLNEILLFNKQSE